MKLPLKTIGVSAVLAGVCAASLLASSTPIYSQQVKSGTNVSYSPQPNIKFTITYNARKQNFGGSVTAKKLPKCGSGWAYHAEVYRNGMVLPGASWSNPVKCSNKTGFVRFNMPAGTRVPPGQYLVNVYEYNWKNNIIVTETRFWQGIVLK